MKLFVNDIEYDVPFDAMEIPLGRYIEYMQQYGEELDKRLLTIIENTPEGDERIEAIDRQLDNEGISWFSFWTGIDLFAADSLPGIQPALDRYRLFRSIFAEAQETAKDISATFEFEGEQWMIQDYKVNPANNMSFNEIATSKVVIQQVKELGQGKWIGMPYLCAIFFRKINEPFTDGLVYENSHRMQLMNRLPLQYALSVGFFLSICVHILSNHFQYSNPMEQQHTQRKNYYSTTNKMVGETSLQQLQNAAYSPSKEAV